MILPRPAPLTLSPKRAVTTRSSPPLPWPSGKEDPYRLPHAADYARRTRDLDLAPVRARFLAEVRARAGSDAVHLLDVGCGPGRDVRAFVEAGCTVEAIDASPDMAALAEEYAGVPVQVMRVEELTWEDGFDGIWACASLLHVPWDDLPEVFRRVARALRPTGVLYASFKLGTGGRMEGGLRFTDMDPARLADRIGHGSGLQVLETWDTPDLRPERRQQRWLNALLVRDPSAD